MGRLVLRALLLLLVVLIVAAGGGYLWLRGSLPDTDGTLALQGLDAPVRITRDAHGVPTIVAASDKDAAFALGFLHAQDRLFQMDLMRRFGAGRLSEWFGTATLGTDRFTRTLGFYRAAERQYPHLSPATRAALDAYAAGVNAYIAGHSGALPPEYELLGVRPEPWRPADTLVWGKIMDLQLTGNYRGELLRARLLQHLTPAQLDILFPAYPDNAPVALRDVKAALGDLPLDALSAALPPELGPRYASNNWVVDGTHSISGKPILANDPHLDFSAPSVWYLVRIKTPKVKLAGVTAPGTPFVVLGHNERIAWGFTTTGSDVEDLFVEKVDPADPKRYLTPTGPQPFAERQEEIRVKGAAPVAITVRATRHGPVISDLGGSAASIPAPGHVLALETTWLGDDDRSPDAIWDMTRARDWQGFRKALENLVAPEQNIVYADVDGNIGFTAPARIPIRRKGDGWLPAPGWTGEYDWSGYIPYDALPTAYNPPSGRVVTANNKIVPDSYPYFLSRDWDAPYRAERITELLERTPKESPDGMAAVQADTVSLMARQLLPLMLDGAAGDERAKPALERLRRWDGRMDRDRPEPLIFIAWLRAFTHAVFAARLGPGFEAYWSLRPEVVRAILTDHQDWCDDPATPRAESCGERLAGALDHALGDIEQRFGRDMAQWRWGAVHQAEFKHPFWSQVPVIGDWLALHIPADGGTYTINNGSMAIWNEAAPYADVHGSTLRMIIDMAQIDEARFMISPGQSGNPLSLHYGDLMRPWRDFAWLRFGMDASGGTLVLAPR